MPPSSRTDANLQVALAGEADANRRYLAYGIRALAEGRADVAQLFFEASGAETIHALEHLRAMGAVASTRENLVTAASGEVQEIDVTLPRMIREAEEDGRSDAAASFRLALERERHHRDMFRHALATFDGAAATSSVPLPSAPATARRMEGAVATIGGVTAASMRRMDGRAHMSELATEPRRIERLASIREVVFGAQDGLVSTFAVIAGLAAAGVGPLVVVLGGAVSAMAGVLSMSIGTFLSSRAQRQLYERELDRERREIRDHAGEEIAELIAALSARGSARPPGSSASASAVSPRWCSAWTFAGKLRASPEGGPAGRTGPGIPATPPRSPSPRSRPRSCASSCCAAARRCRRPPARSRRAACSSTRSTSTRRARG